MSTPDVSGTDSNTTGSNGTGTVAALGEPALLQGYRLAGAVLFPASSEAEIRTAWSTLPDTVAAVVLTPAAAEVLAGDLADPSAPLTVVLPR